MHEICILGDRPRQSQHPRAGVKGRVDGQIRVGGKDVVNFVVRRQCVQIVEGGCDDRVVCRKHWNPLQGEVFGHSNRILLIGRNIGVEFHNDGNRGIPVQFRTYLIGGIRAGDPDDAGALRNLAGWRCDHNGIIGESGHHGISIRTQRVQIFLGRCMVELNNSMSSRQLSGIRDRPRIRLQCSGFKVYLLGRCNESRDQ